MPDIKTKRELAEEAAVLAASFECVRHNNLTYIPADYETLNHSVVPAQDRKIWIPLDRRMLQEKAKVQFGTLFANDSELMNFEFMVAQCAAAVHEPSETLLIKTMGGLKELMPDGSLAEPEGMFVPNTLSAQLNEDDGDRAEMRAILDEWLGDPEEATALLRHLATALAPGWSAVKYVLLLGDGRNGKSVLMQMMEKLFGRHNVSSVSRQEISDKSPVVTELNGKLLNIIYDGVATYLKDSGHEKSLIAGEPVGVRKLYSSELTPVQTNALFIEGLNREPKSSDKSSALQARIVRFWFPNVYADDLEFRDRMLSERMLGALLSLLLDNYVKKEEKAVMLAPTKASKELQLAHMYANSPALQYLAMLESSSAKGADSLIGVDADGLAQMFASWRIKNGDINPWSTPDVIELFRPAVLFERRSKRVNGKVIKARVVAGFKKDTLEFIESLKEDANVVVE